MFTINLEDGSEAPSKARKKGAKRLEFLVQNITHLFTNLGPGISMKNIPDFDCITKE